MQAALVVFVAAAACGAERVDPLVYDLLRAILPKRVIADGELRARLELDSLPENPNFNHTNFCPMPEMDQRRATQVKESDYPWIARVVHTRREHTNMAPLICTAGHIAQRTFITPARCIATAKPTFTTVLLQIFRLRAWGFIVPKHSTKQLFNDIGFILTYGGYVNGEFRHGALPTDYLLTVTSQGRPGDYWYNDWALDASYSVVGFIAREEAPLRQNLYRLDNMFGSNTLCNQIYPAVKNSEDYWAPCVHSCSFDEHAKDSDACHRYLFGLGSLVLDKGGRMVGVVTWTCGNRASDRARRGDLPFPVGIALPNSWYPKHLKCVNKFRSAASSELLAKYRHDFDKLCDKLITLDN